MIWGKQTPEPMRVHTNLVQISNFSQDMAKIATFCKLFITINVSLCIEINIFNFKWVLLVESGVTLLYLQVNA